LPERREFLYGKIEEKINTILELREFVKENERLSADELGNLMEEKMQKIKADYVSKDLVGDEDIGNFEKHVETLFEFEEIDSKIEELKKSFFDLYPDVAQAKAHMYEDKDYQILMQRKSEMSDEYFSVKENDDLRFLKSIYFFLGDNLLKRKFVESYEKKYDEDKDAFFKDIKDETGFSLDDIEDCKIIFKGTNIVIELSESDFERITGSKSVNGYIFNNTPIIFLKDREGKEETLNHERNHSLSESFAGEVRYKQQFLFGLKLALNVLTDFMKKSPPDEESINRLKENIKEKMQGYVFQNFSEIIADIDRLADREIRTYFSNFLDSIEYVEQLIAQTEDEGVREMLRGYLEITQDRYSEYLHKLSNIFFISNELGELDQAKGAILLFKHEQIGKAEKYLKHHFGKNKYEMYEILQPLICNGSYFNDIEPMLEYEVYKAKTEQMLDNEQKNFKVSAVQELLVKLKTKNGFASFFLPSNLSRLKELLGDQKIELSEENKGLIRSGLRKIDWQEIVILNRISLDQLLGIDDDLKAIASVLKIQELNDVVEKGLGAGLLISKFSYCLEGNFDKLEELYENWPFDKDLFQFSLTYATIYSYGGVGSVLLKKDSFYEFLKKIDAKKEIIELLKNLLRNEDKRLT
jgi:hypothetical protein